MAAGKLISLPLDIQWVLIWYLFLPISNHVLLSQVRPDITV